MSALIVGFFSLMIVAGRFLQQENDVRSAAQAAARAASLHDTAVDGETAAVAVANQNLFDSGVACEAQRTYLVPPTNFVPGGLVTVRVECTARSLRALGLGNNFYYYEATEAIDTYRGAP